MVYNGDGSDVDSASDVGVGGGAGGGAVDGGAVDGGDVDSACDGVNGVGT